MKMRTSDTESVTSTITSRDSLEIKAEPPKPRRHDSDATASIHPSDSASQHGVEKSDTKSVPQKRRSSGLDEMVDFMANSRGHSAAIIQRFDKSNMRHLLEMERDVAEIEEELEELRGERVVDREKVKVYERDLRERISEYYQAVLLTKKMMALGRPSKRVLDMTRRAFPPDFGQSSHILSKYHTRDNESDLSTLAPHTEPDLITRIFEKLPDGNNITHIVSFLSALCAVLFLVGAMVGLYFVSNMRARLGLVGMFTVLFAVTIAALTNVRRQEVFVATAAYAAVLVVFVSGNIAANPEPMMCTFSNANQAAAANAQALNTAAASNTVIQAVTVIATAVQTITSTETGSMRTILNTVLSTVTAAPTVVVKKQELSTLAKTGVGVGSAIGALLCIVILGGVIVSCRQRDWGCLGAMFSIRTRRRVTEAEKRRERNEPHRRAWPTDRRSDARGDGEKGKEREEVEAREKDGHVVWV